MRKKPPLILFGKPPGWQFRPLAAASQATRGAWGGVFVAQRTGGGGPIQAREKNQKRRGKTGEKKRNGKGERNKKGDKLKILIFLKFVGN